MRENLSILIGKKLGSARWWLNFTRLDLDALNFLLLSHLGSIREEIICYVRSIQIFEGEPIICCIIRIEGRKFDSI